MQLLARGDDHLALIRCGRRLAAQPDSVIADYVNAHGWVLLIDPAAAPPVTPLTLSSPTKATLFRIILWRCWATVEHGITQPKTPPGSPHSAAPLPSKRSALERGLGRVRSQRVAHGQSGVCCPLEC